MRLNLGSGERLRPGWLNVDRRPLAADAPDFRCADLADLDRVVPDGVVTVAVARDVLEYLPWREIEPMLVLLVRKLRAGGLLYLRTPDGLHLAREFAVGRLPFHQAQQRIYGDQGRPDGVIRSLWTLAEAGRRLRSVGLTVERQLVRRGRVCCWGRRV